jgi:hypothetical protein
VEISQRAEAYIEKNFSPSEASILRDGLASLGGIVLGRGSEFEERIASAIIILAKSDFSDLDKLIVAAERDWRDVLMAAGLQHADWRLGVEALLGSESES